MNIEKIAEYLDEVSEGTDFSFTVEVELFWGPPFCIPFCYQCPKMK